MLGLFVCLAGWGARRESIEGSLVGVLTGCGLVGGCFLQDFLTLYWEFSLNLPVPGITA